MEEIFNKIVDNAKGSIKATEGDYYKDGILYCGNCKTPKQYKLNAFNKEIIVPCLCTCAKEKQNQDEIRLKEQKHNDLIARRKENAFPDSKMQNWTFKNSDRENMNVLNICFNYAKNFQRLYADGKGLMLFGTVGTGKTYYSACIINYLIDKGYKCKMTSLAKISNELQSDFEGKKEYIDNLNRYDLLVLDDLGAERNTEYMNEVIHLVVDSRYESGKPIIITTNLTSDEIKHPKSIEQQRCFSRLLTLCGAIVEVKGKDRRKKEFKEDFKQYDELLGISKESFAAYDIEAFEKQLLEE